MADFVEEYCAIVSEGKDFDSSRLQELRERMTSEELERVFVRLNSKAEAEAPVL